MTYRDTRQQHVARPAAAFVLLACTTPLGHSVTFAEGAHRQLIEAVGAAESEAYRATLRGFDEHLAANPRDFVAAVERCRFIRDFAYRDSTTVESAYEDSEACTRDLTGGEGSALPEVLLFLLEDKWGEEAIRESEALLSASATWPESRQAALHARLSDLYAGENADKAGQHATIAAELDPTSARQITAAEYLVRIGAVRKAVGLIGTLPDDQWNSWTLQRAVLVLLNAKNPQAAFALVTNKASIELEATVRFSLARALLDSGDQAAADAVLREPRQKAAEKGPGTPGYAALREYFELKREYGDRSEAVAAYQELRDVGWRADPFGRYRLSLAATAPLAAWRTRDLLGVGSLLLVLVTMALLPLLIVAPIHYRSVTKRLRGHALPDSNELAPWSLRDMWYALAALLTMVTFAVYLVAYPYFENLLSPVIDAFPSEAPVENAALGRAYLAGNVLCLIAIIPLLRRSSRKSIGGGQWSLRRALLTGFGAALGFLLLAALLKGLFAWGGIVTGPGSEAFRAIQGINEAFGPLATIVFACIATPILEEFIFRGVVLRASARHLALWAAVLVQAVLFAIWHEDVGDYPVFIVFALFSAWLALRSQGLATSMVFHGVVNLVAVTNILRFSDAVNVTG